MVMTDAMLFFFFNDTATTEIYTLSLHDALPISGRPLVAVLRHRLGRWLVRQLHQPHRIRRQRPDLVAGKAPSDVRSEEHTSELQSRQYLVCRLLLEKKKILTHQTPIPTAMD